MDLEFDSLHLFFANFVYCVILTTKRGLALFKLE